MKPIFGNLSDSFIEAYFSFIPSSSFFFIGEIFSSDCDKLLRIPCDSKSYYPAKSVISCC